VEKVRKYLKDFNELVMFQHSIFSLPFIFMAMVVSAHGWFGFKLLVLGGLAAVSARNAAMGFNRYIDRRYDAHNPRTANRPSVDGRIGGKAIVLFILINALLFVGVAYTINSLAFAVSIPVLIVLLSYSYFKRFSSMAHLVLGISLGLAPMAGTIAVSASVPLWSLYLSIGVMFWVAGFDLLYSLQDMAFDKAHNLHSIPSVYGSRVTFNLSLVLHGLTLIFWGLFVYVAQLGLIAQLGVVLALLMLGYEHYLVRKDFTMIDRAFFTVNGYLGFVFFGCIIVDSVYTVGLFR
jgi:4-hydroxybenzoate polyprenyltransferase